MKKFEQGNYILYLEECPKCGSDRDINEQKLVDKASYAIGGLVIGGILGGPVMGIAGGLSIASSKDMMYRALGKIVPKNPKTVAALNRNKWYICPECGSTDIIKKID